MIVLLRLLYFLKKPIMQRIRLIERERQQKKKDRWKSPRAPISLKNFPKLMQCGPYISHFSTSIRLLFWELAAEWGKSFPLSVRNRESAYRTLRKKDKRLKCNNLFNVFLEGTTKQTNQIKESIDIKGYWKYSFRKHRLREISKKGFYLGIWVSANGNMTWLLFLILPQLGVFR